MSGTAGPAAANTIYSVYCANDRVEVDSRNLDQMRSARGSDVCRFGGFSSLSAAQDLARRQFGGTGSSCTCGGAAASQSDATAYSVYCANGRIEVDSRSLAQMRSARGSGVCRFGSFNSLSDAETLAERQFGGKGSSCTCGN